jgi:hypothetical protein
MAPDRPQSLVLRTDTEGGASRRMLLLALTTLPFEPFFETRCHRAFGRTPVSSRAMASLLRMRTLGVRAGEILA